VKPHPFQRDTQEIGMNYGAPDMIEIKSMSATVADDGNNAVVICLLSAEGDVRLKMDRAVLERFCEQATLELERQPKYAS
jgi:hypothetical protein